MNEAANWTPNWQPSPSAESLRAPDSLAMRLRWRLLARPTRPVAALRVNHPEAAAEPQMLLGRWRPLSAPSNPVPPWRWPGRARAERASRRAAIGERWRPLTAR